MPEHITLAATACQLHGQCAETLHVYDGTSMMATSISCPDTVFSNLMQTVHLLLLLMNLLLLTRSTPTAGLVGVALRQETRINMVQITMPAIRLHGWCINMHADNLS